jgi:YidC/Oxa1 family membrane protein insertase
MFELFFYQPILNLLVFLYDIIPGNDLGVAIILLTIIIKLALFPLSRKAIESQKGLQEIQPELEEIKAKYKDNREELGKATLELYKAKKINPFSSCLPLLIQLPFLFAIFMVFQDNFANDALDLVYPFIERPESINTLSFGFFELSNNHNVLLALLAGGALYIQTKMMMDRRPVPKTPPKPGAVEDMMTIMNKQMLYVMPIFTVLISYSFPAGLALYWFVQTLVTIIQQKMLFDESEKKSLETAVTK